jgi:hypothetical protein
MCKPITLHHNEHGYISWCKQCNHINIAFGTIVFAISPKQFEVFISQVNVDVQHYENRICCKEKSLMYNTDSSNVNMVLCYNELLVLADLLNNASLIYEAQQILSA